MDKEKILSFPHMGSYYVPITFLATKLLNMKVMVAPPITKKTLELGSKYSPDFVCVPFKYCLGNFIEALEKGTNVLAQAVGGCRFSYYSEVQQQILKDLGYQFDFIDITPPNKITPLVLYKQFKKINPQLNFLKFGYYFYVTYRLVKIIEKIEDYMRKNMGFEVEKGSFERLHKSFLKELEGIKNNWELTKVWKKYKKLFYSLKIDKPKDCMKVGIIGELYTEMEPFSSCDIERQLAKKGVEVTRITTVSYLLFTKPRTFKKILRRAKPYLEYHIGADGTDSVAKSVAYALKGYDGIIHSKPFACTPEVNAMPMLQNLSKDYKIPILYLSFDSQTSEGGIMTRLEAFYDMLKMRKDKKHEKSILRN
jgi:predicted nucleotide-binding protein (sugar kinase/HSP70/actin superfamily)